MHLHQPEIDCVLLPEGGAEGKGAINALLKLVQGSSDLSAPVAFAKKKGKGAQPLNRPLIAICNDLYAPALRPLRNIARLITFKQTQVTLNVLAYVESGPFCPSKAGTGNHGTKSYEQA